MGACARAWGEGWGVRFGGGIGGLRRSGVRKSLAGTIPPFGTGLLRPNLSGQCPGVEDGLSAEKWVNFSSPFFSLKNLSGLGDGKRLTLFGEAARIQFVSHRPNRYPARQGRTASRPCMARTVKLRPREAAMGFLRPSALKPRWQAPPEGPPVGPPEASSGPYPISGSPISGSRRQANRGVRGFILTKSTRTAVNAPTKGG